MTKTVGVLALQGDFAEHAHSLEKCGAKSMLIKKADQLDSIDGLIIPGGESTTMTILAHRDKLIEPLQSFVKKKPVWGTCAGLILLADRIEGQETIVGGLDVTVQRNYYGRQLESFIAPVDIQDVGIIEADFIRAPGIVTVGKAANTLGAVIHNGKNLSVVVQQGNVLGTAFHTELSTDPRLHKYFLSML